MKYAVVIFDLFGTLTYTISFQEYKDTLIGMASILSVPSDDFVRLWFDAFDQAMKGVFHSLEAQIRHVSQKLGIGQEDTRIKLADKKTPNAIWGDGVVHRASDF